MKLLLEKAYDERGADMGRRNRLPDDTQQPVKLQLVPLRWVDGDYDQGGAYWGNGNDGDNIWCAFNADGVRVFVRAQRREGAKDRVQSVLKGATFYR